MTDDQKVEFEAQGCLVLDAALNPDELEQVRLAFDRAAETDGLDDLPNRDDRFIHLAEHPATFPAVHRILSDDLQVRSLSGTVIPSGAPGRGWRREVASLLGVHHALSTLSVQITIHLDDVPERGTCISVVPGSHRFRPDLAFPDIAHIEEMPHHVALRVKAGAAVLLHGNLWQARTRNQSDASQRLLEITYVHCWMRQALPELSEQAIEVIASSHNLSQLFGIDADETNAQGYWGRRVEGYAPSTGLPERRFSELKVVGKGTAPNS